MQPLSPAETFVRLDPATQTSLLEALAADAGLTVDEVKADLAYRWEGWLARPSQLEPVGEWLYWLLKAGRGYGKTRIGAEWIRKQARSCGRLHLIAPTAADVRDVMVEGESGILAITPREDRPSYYPSRRLIVWPNGCRATTFSAEDPESLRGPQCEKLWADEIAAWQYAQETWDMALLGLRLGDNPQACVTSTPKPIGVYRTLVNDPDCVVTGGSTYENLSNLGPTYRTIISRYEGTNLGRQELLAELLEDEGLAYRFVERIHVVPEFDIPAAWDRFEGMDYGYADSSATAWYVLAVDYEGNLIVFDGLYEPGLPSHIAPQIKQRRLGDWQSDVCYADPTTFSAGKQTKWGREPAPADEYRDLGVPILKALTNDRRTGFIRISELLKLDEHRRFPDWHPLAGSIGAPRLFVVGKASTQELIDQLHDAPLEEEGHGNPLPGEAVDRHWERGKGHAHAALRYAVLSRPQPSERPYVPLDDPRAETLRRLMDRRDNKSGRKFEIV